MFKDLTAGMWLITFEVFTMFRFSISHYPWESDIFQIILCDVLLLVLIFMLRHPTHSDFLK